MSLFDLQDVCMVIGSLATLDLPMIVDLIGIFVLKGPYCTLTMTDWFLQALSVIPRGSWGDDARCFIMIRWEANNRQPLKCRFSREIGRSQAPRRQQGTDLNIQCMFIYCFYRCIDRSGAQNFKSSAVPQERDPDPPVRQQE
ncbi:putative cyclic nucleotide-gated ion channel 17 [Dorcoceras hygrometricum]|uniref:Putative cyclic nucleotide-gated ion channel 17 n=1 Tax=Dorcoceras hygrometricum TaxID=472368 RepID=A0A2Z7CA33_9LAMI|nr:putative cyclic nucleotide-gated ion channel 17 [Dorcoceras hygrometricum]